jgi:hypothetical protein
MPLNDFKRHMIKFDNNIKYSLNSFIFHIFLQKKIIKKDNSYFTNYSNLILFVKFEHHKFSLSNLKRKK